MRVLLVTKPLEPPWNDSGKLVPRDIALAASGRHTLHVMGRGGEGADWPPHVVRHDAVRGQGGFRIGRLDQLDLMRRVWSLRNQADALHFFFQPHPAASAAARMLSRVCARPAIQTALSAPRADHEAGRLVFARRVVTLSSATARRLAPACVTAPRVIPPGIAELVPASAARASAACRAAALSPGFLLYPGDYEFSGGHELLLAAWAAVADLPQLVLAGRDKTPSAAAARARIGERARALGLESRVRLLGTVSDMRGLIAASAGVLFPARSLYGKTDVPLVLLEAWCESRPVLVSDLEPLIELVGGLDAVIPDDAPAWAAAARRLASERDARGAAGRARLMERYTAGHAASAYESLYDELESELHPEGPPR